MLRAAKLAEVPRDIMDRNLKKASDKSQADFSEVMMQCAPCRCRLSFDASACKLTEANTTRVACETRR